MINGFGDVWRAEMICMLNSGRPLNRQVPRELAAPGLEGPVMSFHVAPGDTAITSLGIILG